MANSCKKHLELSKGSSAFNSLTNVSHYFQSEVYFHFFFIVASVSPCSGDNFCRNFHGDLTVTSAHIYYGLSSIFLVLYNLHSHLSVVTLEGISLYHFACKSLQNSGIILIVCGFSWAHTLIATTFSGLSSPLTVIFLFKIHKSVTHKKWKQNE